jgi:hypothetical protein
MLLFMASWGAHKLWQTISCPWPVAWFLVAAPSNIAWKWIQLTRWQKKKTEISQLGTTNNWHWAELGLFASLFSEIHRNIIGSYWIYSNLDQWWPVSMDAKDRNHGSQLWASNRCLHIHSQEMEMAGKPSNLDMYIIATSNSNYLLEVLFIRGIKYIYWLVVYLPLWKMMEFVSWDDDIPNWMESHNPFMFQATNQSKII